jgi:hypothetical protein
MDLKDAIINKVAEYQKDMHSNIVKNKVGKDILEEGFLIASGVKTITTEQMKQISKSNPKLRIAIDNAAAHIQLANAEEFAQKDDLQNAFDYLCVGCVLFGQAIYK